MGSVPTPAPSGPPLPLHALAESRGPYRVHPQSRDSELFALGSRGEWTKPTRKRGVPLDAERTPTVLCGWGGRHMNTNPVVVDPTLPGGRREFTWRESARLQGFPADYVFVGSLTNVRTMIGNAVQIDTARAILEAICRSAMEDR